jgi:hypothetical protein
MTQTKAQRDATLQEVKMYQSNGWEHGNRWWPRTRISFNILVHTRAR